MKKFSKEERSSWRYFWAHWCAFQMVAITLGAWKFKYLFHDWYKPWLKMFGVPYKKIQKYHRTHSKHHIEWLMKNGYYNYSTEKYFDWEALVIDWECSQYTKENCPRGAYEEMLNYLDNAKNIIDDRLLFIGTINYSVVHPREIFKEAYLLSASAIICVHNHPSGNVFPSKEDLKLTSDIQKIGILLGIKLVDHIIIGNDKYYSFLENNDLANS